MGECFPTCHFVLPALKFRQYSNTSCHRWGGLKRKYTGLSIRIRMASRGLMITPPGYPLPNLLQKTNLFKKRQNTGQLQHAKEQSPSQRLTGPFSIPQ